MKISKLFNVSMDNLFNKKALTSSEFIQIAERYFQNNEISLDEKKEILKKMIYLKSESEVQEIMQWYTMTQKSKILYFFRQILCRNISKSYL